MLSVEQKLLAVASRLNPDARHFKQMQHLLPQIKNMDAFIALATREGLAGLLYKNLRKSGSLEALGSPCRQRLHALYHQTLRLNLVRTHALKAILKRCASAGIRVVLLKGAALIQELYQDAGLRPMGDIDLWILPEDLERLAPMLTGSGYEQDPLYPTTFRKGPITLDFKTHLLGADRIKSRALMLRKGQEHIFRRTRVLNVDGEKARGLDPHDQVLYLGLHAFKHNLEKLIWLVDIRELTISWPPSAWQALFTRAAEMGQEKMLFHLVFVLQQLLDCGRPMAVIREYAGQGIPPLEKTILKLRTTKGALPEWAPLIFFSGERSLKKQLKVTLETLFPDPEILRQGFKALPNLSVWQLYVMRFFQLAARAISSLIR